MSEAIGLGHTAPPTAPAATRNRSTLSRELCSTSSISMALNSGREDMKGRFDASYYRKVAPVYAALNAAAMSGNAAGNTSVPPAPPPLPARRALSSFASAENRINNEKQ